jgi:hypothetical protein
MGFIMYLVSVVLSIILFIPAIVVSLFKLRSLKELNDYFARMATGRDAYYNAVCAELFNAFFITRGGYAFGKRKETISSALGKNKEQGTLTWLGKAMDRLLSLIDKDHCLKSIDRTV